MNNRILRQLPFCIQFILSFFGGFSIVYLQFVILWQDVNPFGWDPITKIAFLTLANVFGCVMSFYYHRMAYKDEWIQPDYVDDGPYPPDVNQISK